MMQQNEHVVYSTDGQPTGYTTPYHLPDHNYAPCATPYYATMQTPGYSGHTDTCMQAPEVNRSPPKSKSSRPNRKIKNLLSEPPEEIKFGVLLITRNHDSKGSPIYGQYTFNPHIIKEWSGMSRWHEYNSHLLQDRDFDGNRLVKNVRSLIIEPAKESIDGASRAERGQAHLIWDDSRGDITLHATTTIW